LLAFACDLTLRAFARHILGAIARFQRLFIFAFLIASRDFSLRAFARDFSLRAFARHILGAFARFHL
jgi:hypothetical protein